MALILHFETSGPLCSVAVAQDGQQLALVEHPEVNAHAQQITLIMDAALAKAEVTLEEINAIAVSQGPGSYTGLRVSASAAKGICYAMDIPLIAISTLQSLAYTAAKMAGDKEAVYIPMIDARRMEVYTAVYDLDGVPLEPPHAKIIDASGYKDLVTTEGKTKIYCGSGAAKCKPLIGGSDTIWYDELRCRADNLIGLAHAKYEQAAFEDIAYYKPFYLKSPNITKSRPML